MAVKGLKKNLIKKKKKKHPPGDAFNHFPRFRAGVGGLGPVERLQQDLRKRISHPPQGLHGGRCGLQQMQRERRGQQGLFHRLQSQRYADTRVQDPEDFVVVNKLCVCVCVVCACAHACVCLCAFVCARVRACVCLCVREERKLYYISYANLPTGLKQST